MFKKILISAVIICFFQPCPAAYTDSTVKLKGSIKNYEPIYDNLIEKSDSKRSEIITPQEKILDTLISEIDIKNVKKTSDCKNVINDKYASEIKLSKKEIASYSRFINKTPIRDHSPSVKIAMNPKKKIISTSQYNDGDPVSFVVSEDVKVNGKIIVKKGATVSGRIATISRNGYGGVPAEMIFEDLSVATTTHKKLRISKNIEIMGANRALWVQPLANLLPFELTLGLNTAFLLIKGGHAKVTPDDTLIVEYIP